MKIKSSVWHWLAVACGSVGLVLGMGAEGAAQTGGAINGNTFTTAVVLVLLGLLVLVCWLRLLRSSRSDSLRKRRFEGLNGSL